MRIGLVHPGLDGRGGAENVVLWMARGLLQRGFEVVVATDRFSAARWEPSDWAGIPLVVLEPPRWEVLAPPAAHERALAARLRSALAGCELIVAHNAPAPSWATRAARRMPGTRVIWFCEEPKARLHWRRTMPTIAAAVDRYERYPWALDGFQSLRRAERRKARSRRFARQRRRDIAAAHRVDLVLANSPFTAKVAEAVYGRSVLPCLLGAPRPPAVAARPRAPYVTWVAGSAFHKNGQGFMEAIRIAVHELGARDLRMRVVGLDPEVFGRRAREAGLEAVVSFSGWLEDAELNERIGGCRLLAYPSIDEPFGLVPLHAMAHGRPVLTSNVGGPAETVLDRVTGLHAHPLDPRDMAARLVELWRDPARCEALGAAGRERYHAQFTFDRFLDRFERLVFGPRGAGA